MSHLYRYTNNDEGIFSAGKRLLPEELVTEALENKKWLIKPDLPELPDGEYQFYLTQKGKEQYEATLLHTHKKYLYNIKLETYAKEDIKDIVYKDEFQIVTLK